jgi:hypothetical protein
MARISKQQIAKAKARYEAGESLQVIANDLQCHMTAVRYHAVKGGWQKSANSVRQTLPSKEITQSEKRGIPPAIPQKPIEEIGIQVRSKLASNIQTTLDRVSELRPDDMKEEVQLETVLGSLTKRAATVFGWSEAQAIPAVSLTLLGALPDREITVSPSREEASD